MYLKLSNCNTADLDPILVNLDNVREIYDLDGKTVLSFVFDPGNDSTHQVVVEESLDEILQMLNRSRDPVPPTSKPAPKRGRSR